MRCRGCDTLFAIDEKASPNRWVRRGGDACRISDACRSDVCDGNTGKQSGPAQLLHQEKSSRRSMQQTACRGWKNRVRSEDVPGRIAERGSPFRSTVESQGRWKSVCHEDAGPSAVGEDCIWRSAAGDDCFRGSGTAYLIAGFSDLNNS
jgi:hypothetical protein